METTMIKDTITFTNDFHNTSINLHIYNDYWVLSARQARRAREELCGLSDCTCGGELGERGPQWFNGRRVEVVSSSDGEVELFVIKELVDHE